MPISKWKIAFFIVSFLLSSAAAGAAISIGSKIPDLTDLLATIISILIGVSLAISALLSPNRSDANSSTFTGRQASIAASDDANLYDGQVFIFYVYYTSLILGVLIKFASLSNADFHSLMWGKCLIASFVFVSAFALLWSATLPSLLRSIADSRN